MRTPPRPKSTPARISSIVSLREGGGIPSRARMSRTARTRVPTTRSVKPVVRSTLPLRSPSTLYPSRPFGLYLTMALEPVDAFRRTLEHAHEGVELPFARHGAAHEPPEHDLRAAAFVLGVVRRLEEVGERFMELLLLEPGGLAPRAGRRAGREELVQKDGRGVGEVEDRVVRRGGDGHEQVAA